eukprot:3497-Heterococcus_DN1.PRE.3
MKVIGTGFARTGTMSLKAALEQLGYGPCYHMIEVINHKEHMATWLAAAKREKVDWVTFFDGWESCVDAPTCCVWRELLIAFPDALVLHHVLPPDRWYDSSYETIYKHGINLYPKWWQAVFPWSKQWTFMLDTLYWKGLFQGRFEDREFAINVFNKRTEEASKTKHHIQTLSKC